MIPQLGRRTRCVTEQCNKRAARSGAGGSRVCAEGGSSGPHGWCRPRRNIWFTGNFKGYIGKLDPGREPYGIRFLIEGQDPHTGCLIARACFGSHFRWPIWWQAGSAQRKNRAETCTHAVIRILMGSPSTARAFPFSASCDNRSRSILNDAITEYALPEGPAATNGIDTIDRVYYDFSRGI